MIHGSRKEPNIFVKSGKTSFNTPSVKTVVLASTPMENSEIYIYNILTKKVIRFQNTPESISDSYSPQYESTDVVGRSTPLLSYKGGSSRELSFSVKFHEDIISDSFKNSSGEKDIRLFVDALRAATMPMYSNGIQSPKVYVKVFNMYSFWGVMDVSEVTYSGPLRNGRMIVADLNFKFTRLGAFNNYSDQYSVDPLDAATIESSGHNV